MGHERRAAGLGSILFAVLLIAALITVNAPGGEYKAQDVADFVAKSSVQVIIALLLVAGAVVALLVAVSYLCEAYGVSGRSSRIAWGATLLAGGAYITGFTILVTPVTSGSLGGGPDIDPAVAYTLMQIGWGVFLVVTGVMLGLALLTFAITAHAAPVWLRGFTGLVGLAAVFSFMFLPSLSVPLWALVTGVWLLVSSPKTAPVAAEAAAS